MEKVYLLHRNTLEDSCRIRAFLKCTLAHLSFEDALTLRREKEGRVLCRDPRDTHRSQLASVRKRETAGCAESQPVGADLPVLDFADCAEMRSQP